MESRKKVRSSNKWGEQGGAGGASKRESEIRESESDNIIEWRQGKADEGE